VPIGIVAFVVAMVVVRESKNPEGRHLDLPGQLLAITGIASLTYALIEANARGWTSPLILTLFAVSALTLTAFFVVESRTASPMLQLHFFRNPTFAAANAVAAIVSFGMFGIFFFLSLFFQNIQGYTAFQAGVRQLPATLMIIIAAPIAGQLAGRIGPRLPMVAGLTFAGSSLLLMTRVDAGDPYSTIWPYLVLMGLGMGLVMSPMTAAVMASVPLRRAGMASATSSTSREVGGVFGIALLGAIVTHWFTKDLSAQLANLPIPAEAKAQIITVASRGGQEATGALQLDTVQAQALHHAIDQAFVHGMHIGLTVAGFTVLGGAVIAFVFVRRPALANVVETPPTVEPQVATVIDTA